VTVMVGKGRYLQYHTIPYHTTYQLLSRIPAPTRHFFVVHTIHTTTQGMDLNNSANSRFEGLINGMIIIYDEDEADMRMLMKRRRC
jgi:hypothetical protein